jgi:hypothetical protein
MHGNINKITQFTLAVFFSFVLILNIPFLPPMNMSTSVQASTTEEASGDDSTGDDSTGDDSTGDDSTGDDSNCEDEEGAYSCPDKDDEPAKDNGDNNDNDNNNNKDDNDKSEIDSKDNDPCDLHGRDICDENGDCDDNNFDCITDLGDGKYCTTGMCPGDDKEKEKDGDKKPKLDSPDCDDSYPDDCIPSPPPDLNCGDEGVPNNIKVEGNDPHGFDGNDNDGIGCESGDDENNNGKDKSETKNNNPCNYYGLDVCDKNKNGCDSNNFDCLTDLGNGDYCTTGMCPGDDKQNCWKNQKFVGCPDGNDNDNNKKKSSGSSNNNNNNNGKDMDDSNNPILKTLNKIFDSNKNSDTNVKKFEVKVILDNVTAAESDIFSMRVIVYGPHTLNKPTLDKPGQVVNVQGCGQSCYTDWGFTAAKVPIGSEIQACVWNSETGHQKCGYGKSDSLYGPEIIRVSLPSLN